MIPIPQGVTTCLYSGISSKIEFIKRELESPMPLDRSYLQKYYKDVVEAVEFYKKHCVLSAKYLIDALDEIRPHFENNIKKASQIEMP
jgi:hypothetical protein